MKLVRADGNIRMQIALSHSYVRTIVDILLQHRDTLGFVAEVLQTYTRPDEPGLAKMLAGIRDTYSQLDAEGNTILPTHIGNLTEALGKLYQQNIEKIEDQRGAIVELFARKLICPRYNNDQECANSRRFEDSQGRRITIQEVDVAALSYSRGYVEGYECKLKASGLSSDDCVDLAYLIKAAQESGYRANVGVVSFDSDKIVKRRLNRLQLSIRHLPSAKSIKVYGLESVELLHNDPFDKEGR